MTLQSVILIVLPVFTPMIGSALAAILAQDKWPVWANDLVAWVVLLLFAAGDMWANSQLTGGWVEVAADGVQAITLLSSGWLVKLGPWLVWIQWLQANVFNLVPLFEKLNQPAPVNANPVTSIGTSAVAPTPIQLPAGSTTVPPRASATDTTPGA